MLRFYLLGSLRVSSNEVLLDLATPPKTLQLLSYLLLYRQRTFTRDQLAFTLWPDRTEAAARGQLRRYLYRLRQFLPEGEWLTLQGEQVQWNNASNFWLDVDEFERLSQGPPDRLEAALKLYADDLLVDLYEDWIIIERERLRNLFLDDAQRLLEHYREQQLYDRAIACALLILKQEPLHEATVRELMQLRTVAGDRNRALDDYRQFQRRVIDELGVQPMPETMALYETLRQAPFVSTRPLAPVPLRPTNPRRVKAPVPLTHLLGREQELTALQELLLGSTTRLLTLTGPGGTGKTRLAQEIAQRLAPYPHEFADGIFYVSLSALTAPHLVLPALAKALEVPENSQQLLLEATQDILRDRDALLILDNFEHVLEATPLVVELLSVSADLRVLITSREALHVYGEYEFTVPPLPLPDLAHLPPADELANYAAIALFVERARAVNAEFTLNVDNAASVAEICTRLDGLPLAIELAAARSKLFTPQIMLQRLSDRLSFLVGPGRDRPDRQRTLRNVIEWSYHLLSESEKILFTRLSIFAGSFTAEAVQVLALAQPTATGEPAAEVLDQLAALIDKNMLRMAKIESGGAPRFQMLLTLREYAQEKLVARGEYAELQVRHIQYRCTVAREGVPALHGPQQLEWMRRLEADRDNFRAVLSWTLEQAPEHAKEGLRLAVLLGRFWSLHGDWTEGTQWLTRALGENPQASSVLRAWGKSLLSELLDKLGQISEAEVAATDSQALFRELGDTRGLAEALCNQGGARLSQNDYARAEPLLQEALALYRQIDFRTGAATALSYLGMLAKEQGDYERAIAYQRESLELNRAAGNELGIAQDLTQLSFIAYWQSHYEQSVELGRQALDLSRRMNNRRGVASALDGLGAALGKLGRYAEAWENLAEGLTLYQELGNKSGQAMMLVDLATVAMQQNDRPRAAPLYRQALALAHQIGDRRRVAFCLEGLSVTTVETDPEHATCWLSAATALRQAIDSPVPPSEQADYERVLARLQATLPPALFEAAWQWGQHTPLDEMVKALLASPSPDF